MMVKNDASPKPSIWAWPDATLGQRAAAFVVDGLIVASICSLVQVLAGRFVEDLTLFCLQVLLALIYFVILQLEGRRTFGQRVAGIRLIGLQIQDIDDGIPFVTLALREAVWFPLSCLLLGAGIVMVLFRRDRMSLHDLISRTRVVTMSHEPSSAPVRLSLVLSVVLASTILIGAAIVGVSRLTVLPIRRVVHDLELLGYKVGRVGGNLTSGFTIEKLSFETDEIQCELSGLRFSYQTPSEGTRGAALIPELTIAEAKIAIQKPTTEFQASLPDIKWLIKAVEVHQMILQLPGHGPFKTNRFALSNLFVDSGKKVLRLDRLWLESEVLWLDLFDLALKSHSFAINRVSRMQIRPGFFPEVLVAPLDVSFEGAIEDGQIERVKLEALGGAVKFGAREDSGALTLHGFTPARYFNTGMPLAELEMRATGNLLAGEINEAAGTAEIGGQKFTLGPEGFSLARGKRRYLIAPKISPRWREWLLGKEPAAILKSDDEAGVMSHLAEIYYSRSLNELSTSEVEQIKRDHVFFESGPAFGSLRFPSAVPVTPESR